MYLNFPLLLIRPLSTLQNCPTHVKPGASDATSLLHPICNFYFVIAIAIVQILGLYERHQQITVSGEIA